MELSAAAAAAVAATGDATAIVHPANKEPALFIRNLHRMLETESDEILRWTPDGCAFEILDMDRMSSSVLPKYFKHRNKASFQRQLNYFGFRKWTKSRALVCTFSNELFIRDHPELAWRISRKKSVSHPGHKATAASLLTNASVRTKSTPAFSAKFVVSASAFSAAANECQRQQEHQELERRRRVEGMVSQSKFSDPGVLHHY